MANTARTLVTNALVTGGIIEPTENAEDSEIAHGLHELNLLLDTLNQEKMFPFTSNRIDARMVPSQDHLTIGVGDGIQLTGITTDGVVQVYTTKKDHGYQQQDNIQTLDTTNFDVDPGLVLEETDRTFTIATQAIPAINDAIAFVDIFTDASPLTVAFNSATTYNVGDVIIVTDSVNYAIVGEISNVINPTLVELTNEDVYQSGLGIPLINGMRYELGSGFLYANRVLYPRERSGYVYEVGQDIPDVRAQRPDTINSMLLTFDTYQERIRFYPVRQWDECPKQISSAGRPTAYTYYTSFPFGSIQFNPKPDQEYPITINYDSYVCNLELDDELNLPQGYESTLQYLLADILCVNYKIDSPRVAQIAAERKATLKRNNYKPNVLESDLDRAGQYDIYGDQYL